MARQTETDNKCTALKKRPYRKYKGLLESDATCWRSGRFVVVHESGKPCSGSSGDKNRGTRGAIHVLDDKGRTVTRRSFKKRYDAMKARALPGGPLLIEVGRNGGDAADIYTVSSKGRLRRRYINAFLALPTSPNACGSCGD